MPRFAANLSMLFGELPLVERFEAARRAGFGAVELQFPYELPAETLLAAQREAGLPLVLFNVPAGALLAGGDGLACVPGAERAQDEALAQALDYARVLRPRAINLLAGRVPVGASRDECLRVFDRSLRRASPALRALGVIPVVEALNGEDVPRFLLQDHADLLAAIEGVDAAAQYDVYHQTRMGRDVRADLLADLGRIAHVQIADVPGRGAPGSGTIDFDALFALLDAQGYPGWVGAEYRPGGPSEPTLAWLRALAQ